ncbi:unnamed protein product [Paramecium primaurelia]|uniref:cGMP-dependent protein kinase n=1 Tax=Paramecium primaurelia TaxID=5886 RepID=A0A8S1KI24_PARPR|nr:unnamed protein product [Paramecium primaurelia]
MIKIRNSFFGKKFKIIKIESLTDDQKAAIPSALINLNFKAGKIIVNEGDQADSFFIMKKGEIQISRGGKETRVMKEGESLGEQALYQNSVRGATAKAIKEDVTVLALARDDLTRILGDKIQLIMYSNLQRWAFERQVVLSKLTKLQVEIIVSNMQQKQKKSEEIIIEKGQACREIIIILQGSIKYGKEILEKGQMFGDKFLDQGENVKLGDTVIMKDERMIAIITFKQMKKAHDRFIKKEEGQKQDVFKHFQLDQLIYVKKLGLGQFGNVYLVHNKMDKKIYALKCISKAQIIEQNLEKHLAQEKISLRKCQFSINSAFCQKFQRQYLYLLLGIYIRGVCLYEFMCGNVPYAEMQTTRKFVYEISIRYEIYEEIQQKQLTFPSVLKDRKAKKLIEQLLSKTPELRLGSSYASLKNNPFFERFDYDLLINRELKPPYLPPKNKLHSDKDAQKAIQVGKLITEKIKNDLDTAQNVYKPEKARDPNWDKEY